MQVLTTAPLPLPTGQHPTARCTAKGSRRPGRSGRGPSRRPTARLGRARDDARTSPAQANTRRDGNPHLKAPWIARSPRGAAATDRWLRSDHRTRREQRDLARRRSVRLGHSRGAPTRRVGRVDGTRSRLVERDEEHASAHHGAPPSPHRYVISARRTGRRFASLQSVCLLERMPCVPVIASPSAGAISLDCA